MRFDFSGARTFLQYINNEVALEKVISHPAYQAVMSHNNQFAFGMTPSDIADALAGEDTPFYGLNGVRGNLNRIAEAIECIKGRADEWVRIIKEEISYLLPEQSLDNIVIYPIVGYDTGIGHNGAVCMNLNSEKYLSDPQEMLYVAIHEVFHVIYERIHKLTKLRDLHTLQQFMDFFFIMFQNEGYAVYAALRRRKKDGYMGRKQDRVLSDYVVLQDPEEMRKHIDEFLSVVDWFAELDSVDIDDFIARTFGPMRLTYRVGCELICRIEKELGVEAVRQAVYLSGSDFYSQYAYLLEQDYSVGME